MKADFPALSPGCSFGLEQGCGASKRQMTDMFSGLLVPQFSCLGMMGQQAPIWEDLFISCHGNSGL